jgi:glycosyltransferase involved in cell wall biosynthesis
VKAGPLVSCVIPCFNGARFLDDAIESILDQTYRDLEVIVIDDGSTDESAVIVRRYGDAVRYQWQENRGPGAACNAGVAVARGEFVAFLEQDDLWVPAKTRRQLDEFERHPELEFCVTHIQNFWVPELQPEAERYRDHPAMRPVPGYVVQTLMARRDLFERFASFNEELRFAFASDWFMRASDDGVVGALIPDTLVRRRLHESNYSRVHRAASHDQFLHVLKATLDRRRSR